MYKNILLPTDGSVLSARAIESGVRLAKAVGARVTGLHVTPKMSATALDQWARGERGTKTRLAGIFNEQAKHYLAAIETKAAKAGVRCGCLRVTGDAPHEEILRTAANKGCDLIYMASHGKRGASALPLGSETAKVLTHSRIPVLVHRELRRSGRLPRLAADRSRDGSRPSLAERQQRKTACAVGLRSMSTRCENWAASRSTVFRSTVFVPG